MRLTEKEYNQYLRIHPALIHYAGLKENLIKKGVDLAKFMNSSSKDKFPARNSVYDNPKYIDEFVKENPYGLSAEDIEIAKEFKQFKRGKFWIVKYLKNYTIFLDENYAYGVLALNDPFEMFWGNSLPTMVEAVLLPFKGKIVYDGLFQVYNISFGRGISSSIVNDFNDAKTKYGIITSLPIDKKIKNVKFTDEDKLKLYMKTASSRDQYWYEIEELLEKKPSLEKLYYQLWGKINSRAKKKRLKELGIIKGYYFAIYDDVIIASGKTKIELEKQLNQMLKKENLDSIHIFNL